MINNEEINEVDEMPKIKVEAVADKQFFPKNDEKIEHGDFAILTWKIKKVLEGEPYTHPWFKTMTAKGNVCEIEDGEVYTIVATRDKDETWGIQYNIDYIFQPMDLTSTKDQRTFLSKILTEKQVSDLFTTFEKPLDYIADADIENLITVKGIGEKTAERMINKYHLTKDYSKIYVELDGYDLTSNMINNLVAKYKSPDIVVSKIKENPYVLATEVHGVGFKKADEIALSHSMDWDNPNRVEAFILHLLNTEGEKGNSYVYANFLMYDIEDALGDISSEVIGQAMKSLVDSGKVGIDETNEEYKRVYLTKYKRLEQQVSDELLRILGGENVSIPKNWRQDVLNLEDKQGWQYTDEQVEGVKTVLENQVAMVTGAAGVGKAQPLHSKVLTPSGFVSMGSLTVGDDVIGDDGKTHKVIGVYPQGKKDIYRITFSDGESAECCKEHLWKVTDRISGYKTKVVDIEEMLEKKLVIKNSAGDNKWRYVIPMTQPVNFPSSKTCIDPYFLGLMLGDGCIGEDLTFTNNEDDVASEARQYIESLGLVWTRREHPDGRLRNYRITKTKDGEKENILKALFRKLGLYGKTSKDKFIPRQYLLGDIETRRRTLEGLINTDGSVSPYRIQFSTVSKQLSEDVRFLVYSLGGTTTDGTEQTRPFDKNLPIPDDFISNTIYKMDITIPNDIPIATSRKHRSKFKGFKRKINRRIESIELIGKEECQCIMVDNPSHLYITDGFAVTHNTTIVSGMLEVLREDKGYTTALCALSGKAGAKLSEVAGKGGHTMHKLLEYSPRDGFGKNEENKLDYDIVIVDEVSMVGLPLFLKLLQAIKTNTKLICMGDINQLESIGSGNLAVDMLNSQPIPLTRLTKIHRQAQKSGIITESQKIKGGVQLFERGFEGISIRGELKDFELDVSTDRETMKDRMIKHFIKWFDIKKNIMEVQLVVPIRERGDCCVDTLNEAVQNIYNPWNRNRKEVVVMLNKKEDKKYTLREGDKVLISKNNYQTANLDGENTPIFNGWIGIIEEITTEGKGGVIINFPIIKDTVIVPLDKLDTIRLGYANSVHSMQGSDCPIIIGGIDYSTPPFMLTRELVYTLVTRAEEHVVLVCQNGAIRDAIETSNVSEKNTFLREMLDEGVGKTV